MVCAQYSQLMIGSEIVGSYIISSFYETILVHETSLLSRQRTFVVSKP